MSRARTGIVLAFAGLVLTLLSALPAQGAVLPSGFRDEAVLSGIEEPTSFDFSPDGRVFVAEKAGKVLVYDDLEDETPTLFADLRTDVYDSGDRGILGMELDPQFPARPFVYLIYTYDHLLGDPSPAPKWGEEDDTGDECPKPPEVTDVDACPVSGRIVRLEAGGPGGNQMVDELPLVESWCQQFSSHSVGDIQFDAVGNLYASGGEGATAMAADYGQFSWPEKNQCNDAPVDIDEALTVPTAEGGALRSQDAFTPFDPLAPHADPTGLSGSIIRINPDTGEGVEGNPMFDSPDANERRIVGYGFRNPFRFDLDESEDDLYVANVGWQEYEEIDHLAVDSNAAFNSGWPCYEGPVRHFMYEGLSLNLCNALYASETTSSPFFAYPYFSRVYPDDPCDWESGSAISGISVYRDESFANPFPETYDGALFFADSVRSCIYAMLPDSEGKPDPSNIVAFLSDGGVYPGVDIEVGEDGSLFYARIFGGEGGKGALHRISYDAEAPVARLTAEPTYGAADPLPVDLDASGSTDPQGEDLTYDWDLDGDGNFDEIENGAAVLSGQPIAGPAPRRIAVQVEDEAGHTGVARATLHPGNEAPEPEIEDPTADLDWAVGDTIEFEGAATDPEDGAVETADLYWRVRMHHCPALNSCHQHPLQVFPAAEGGSIVAPDHDYPARLEILLTATDSEGLSETEVMVLEPRTVDIEIASEPSGLGLTANLKADTTPFDLTAIEGGNIVLSAPESQSLGGETYSWQSWSDGGERVHTVVADAPGQYTANYVLDEPGPEFSLTLEKGGTGEGTVTSSPSGIACGPACDGEVAEFPGGEVVTLSQTPAAGSEFGEWDGCEAEDAGDCQVTMDQAEQVEATFDEKPTDEPEEPSEPDNPGVPADPGVPDGPSSPVLGAPGPPQTRLLGHPAKKTTKSTARFRFDSNMADARFECILDQRDYVPCRSPRVYRKLRPGKHVFTVVAVSSSEIADPTPAKFNWRVLAQRRAGKPASRDSRRAVASLALERQQRAWICHLRRNYGSWNSPTAAATTGVPPQRQ